MLTAGYKPCSDYSGDNSLKKGEDMDIEQKARRFLDEHPEEVERLSRLVDWLLRDERWMAVILRRDLMWRKGIQDPSMVDMKKASANETLRECGECIL